MIQERNLAVAIILSFVTCGIYAIYWMVCINNDVDAVSNNQNPRNAVVVILLSIVTCGIYEMYWWYQNGQFIEQAGKDKNVQTSSNAILFLILAIFGLGIVNYIIAQVDLNKFAAPKAA